MSAPYPRPAVGVGEVGREERGESGRVGGGGVRPEFCIGSVEPVNSEAAVAAAEGPVRPACAAVAEPNHAAKEPEGCW